MQIEFIDSKLAKLYETGNDKWQYPPWVVQRFQDRVEQLSYAHHLSDLKNIISLNLEKMKEYGDNRRSVRLNKQRRLLFIYDDNWITQVIWIKEISKHYE